MAHGIASVLLLVMVIGFSLWTAGAIYFDVGRGARWSWAPAVGWCLFALVLLATWQPLWRPVAVLLTTNFVFLGWWLSLKPSHDRQWDASVSVLPRVVRQDDVVSIENVRNNKYRSFDDFTARYETRTYLNKIAETAPEEGFGDYLRREIERLRHGR